MTARKRIAILISGRGSNMAALLKSCADPAYPAQAALVLSNNPGAAGLAVAAQAGITTRVIDHRGFAGREAFDAAMDAALRDAGIDIVCLAGFMRLLTPGFVDSWRDRMINIHPSLLPAFKGLHTHERALAAGVKITGCTVHLVRPEMDEGPIIAQAAVPVAPDDTPETLAARVLDQEHRLYPLGLALLATGRVRVEGERAVVRGDGGWGQALSNPLS